MNSFKNDEYAEKIKISNKTALVVKNANSHLYTWLEGSAQSGKSVAAALAISTIIDNSSADDKLFLALGYTLTSVKNNVFECGGFGVQYYFGARCKQVKYQGVADALQIYTKTGVKYLVAFGTSTRTSNNVWHGWHISGFIFDEIDRACQESIDEMQQRIIAVQEPHIVATQNPNSPKHPIYKFLKELEDKGLVYYSHWNLNDNTALSPEKVEEIKARYTPGSVWYRKYILGERCDAEGLIYNIKDSNIIDSFNPEDYSEYIIIADPGVNCSMTCFVLAALRNNNMGLDILRDYSHRNADYRESQQKFPQDYANDYLEFFEDSINIMGKLPKAVLLDRDITFYKCLLSAFKAKGYGTSFIKYVSKEINNDKTIDARINADIALLYKNKLRFHKDCSTTIKSFKEAIYDPKESEKGKLVRYDNPQSDNHIDAIDATEYGVIYYYNRLFKNTL